LEVERKRRGKGGSKSGADEAATDADEIAGGGTRPLAMRLREVIYAAKEPEPGFFQFGLSLFKHVWDRSHVFLGPAA